MGLDQLAAVVDAHQLAVHPDLHLLTRPAEVGRHRVEGIQALDVMVPMDHVGAPLGDVIGRGVPGKQGVALLILENHQRLLAVVPWLRVPATSRHHLARAARTWAKSSKSAPLKKRSRA